MVQPLSPILTQSRRELISRASKRLKMIMWLIIFSLALILIWIQPVELAGKSKLFQECLGSSIPELSLTQNQSSNPSVSLTKDESTLPCHFVVDTGSFDIHQEFIESVIAKWPVQASVELPPRCADHPYIFHVRQGGHRSRNFQWKDYAKKHMMKRVYHDESGKERRLGFVGSTHKKFLPLNVTYLARIILSCYCNNEDIVAVVMAANTYCYFHETCPAMVNHPRAYWVHPSQPRVFFPDVQPPLTRPKVSSPFEFCTVGSIGRRDWNLVTDLLTTHHIVVRDKIKFHLLGNGKIPTALSSTNYTVSVRQTVLTGFLEFETALATNCHVLMALVSKTKNVIYFANATKATGTIVHATAYQIPTVLHEDLFPIYQKYLPSEVETHSDDPKSFTNAILKMVDRLEKISNTQSPEIVE